MFLSYQKKNVSKAFLKSGLRKTFEKTIQEEENQRVFVEKKNKRNFPSLLFFSFLVFLCNCLLLFDLPLPLTSLPFLTQ